MCKIMIGDNNFQECCGHVYQCCYVDLSFFYSCSFDLVAKDEDYVALVLATIIEPYVIDEPQNGPSFSQMLGATLARIQPLSKPPLSFITTSENACSHNVKMKLNYTKVCWRNVNLDSFFKAIDQLSLTLHCTKCRTLPECFSP